MKPTLVGESNPYSNDEQYALYPLPVGCAGYRLCSIILGMQRRHYLEAFNRCDLVKGKWSLPTAREKAYRLLASERPLILLGAKVCSAFKFPFEPFRVFNSIALVLPHPSGLCRLWSQEGIIRQARNAVRQFVDKETSMLIPEYYQ